MTVTFDVKVGASDIYASGFIKVEHGGKAAEGETRVRGSKGNMTRPEAI